MFRPDGTPMTQLEYIEHLEAELVDCREELAMCQRELDRA